MGQLRILNQSGDEKLEWDPGDSESVEKAHREWRRLKDKGYEFFEVAEAKGRLLKKFDKRLGKVLAAPGVGAMAGGPVARP